MEATDISSNAVSPREIPARNVLVVEDDPDIAAIIKLHLEDAGFPVTLVNDGWRGLELALQRRFSLLVLDLMLPGVGGLEICKRLVSAPTRPLILMLTSRASEQDRVLGLELGADDYLTKPFAVPELVARVRALLRRPPLAALSVSASGVTIVRAGSLLVDRNTHGVELRGRQIKLTSREFDLLHWFAAHPGRIFSRAALLNAVWGAGYEGYEHTVNSHLNRLRTKLEDDTALPKILVTERGVGYKLVPPQ